MGDPERQSKNTDYTALSRESNGQAVRKNGEKKIHLEGEKMSEGVQMTNGKEKV